MKIFSFTVLLFFLAAAAALSLGQTRERDAAKESLVQEELRAVSPSVVGAFISATEAMDAGNFAEAEKLYANVLVKAPDFDPALRRLGYVKIALGQRAEGLELCQKALSKNRSFENLISKASSLMYSREENFRPTKSEAAEALQLSKEAWQKSGQSDEQSAGVALETMLFLDQMAEFTNLAVEFRGKFPDSPVAGYYNAIALANKEDFDAAEVEIDRIRKLGVPEESLSPLLLAISNARDASYFGLGAYRNYFYMVVGLVVIWALGLAGLFIGGWLLSAKTLKAIEESDPNDVSGGSHARLRKVYRRVISIAGAYYYISQPFVIFLVIAFTVGVLFFFLLIGTIPIKLMLVLGFVALASIFYMIRSLLTRAKIEDPGRILTEPEAPGLWKLVRDVANTIQTRPADEIRITHGADLAVYERGGFRAKMNDNAERILIIGVAVLNDFEQNAFRAVLAHEYGHFSNRDTAGGDIAFRVNSDLLRTAESMAIGGTATYYNLGFQFLRLFHFIFRRITHGATRLQEVLADRVAAYNYGPVAFRNGLNHVIRRELEFNKLADGEINAALGSNRALQNLYELSLNEEKAVQDIEKELEEAVNRPTTPDDTHPSPSDRFRYVDRIRSKDIQPLDGNVWDLFADKDAITSEMNALIEKLVRPGRQTNTESFLGIG